MAEEHVREYKSFAELKTDIATTANILDFYYEELDDYGKEEHRLYNALHQLINDVSLGHESEKK